MPDAITLLSYFTKKYGANKMATTYVIKVFALQTGEAVSGTTSHIRYLRPQEAEIMTAFFRSKLKPVAFKEKRLPEFQQSKKKDFSKVYLISYFKKKYGKSWSGVEHICKKLMLNLKEARHGTRYRHVYLDGDDAEKIIEYLESGMKLSEFAKENSDGQDNQSDSADYQ